jgi:molecular chaperone DnaK
VSGFRLGIDYGTSNTVAMLRWPDGRVRPLMFDGAPVLPSAVFAGSDGRLLVGHDAERSARLDPARFEPNPKRRVDDGDLLLGGSQVPVVEILASTLRRVAEESARAAAGLPSAVVLTHPASWGLPRRAVLLDAAQRAGLGTPALLPEPVAAARYYTTSVRDLVPGRCLLVYDLGAGTFDASLLRRTPHGFDVLAVGGLDDFGGVDLDELVIGQVAAAVAAEAPQAWHRLTAPTAPEERRQSRTLWEDARCAKEALSRQSWFGLHVPLVDRELHVSREEFERVAAPALSRTIDSTMALLAGAKVGVDQLGDLLLVGGSTRIPLVATLLHRRFGIPPTVCDQPELVVAEGALTAAVAISAPVQPVSPPAYAPAPPRPVMIAPGPPYARLTTSVSVPVRVRQSVDPRGLRAARKLGGVALGGSVLTIVASCIPGFLSVAYNVTFLALLVGIALARPGGWFRRGMLAAWAVADVVAWWGSEVAGSPSSSVGPFPKAPPVLLWTAGVALVVGVSAGVSSIAGRWLPGRRRYFPLLLVLPTVMIAALYLLAHNVDLGPPMDANSGWTNGMTVLLFWLVCLLASPFPLAIGLLTLPRAVTPQAEQETSQAN